MPPAGSKMHVLSQERGDELFYRRVTLTEPEVVDAETGKAGGVCQQVPQSHLIAPGALVAVQAEFGQGFHHGPVEPQQPAIHARHHGGRGYRLGYRRDAPQRVTAGGTPGLDIRQTPITLGDEVVTAGDEEGGPGQHAGAHPLGYEPDRFLESTFVHAARGHGDRIDLKHPSAEH